MPDTYITKPSLGLDLKPGRVDVICTDHPSQLLASKANQKTPA